MDVRPTAPWQVAKLVPWEPLPVLIAVQVPSVEEQMTSYHSQKRE